MLLNIVIYYWLLKNVYSNITEKISRLIINYIKDNDNTSKYTKNTNLNIQI